MSSIKSATPYTDPGQHLHGSKPLARKPLCGLSGRVPCPATSAGVVSLYVFAVKSRYPHSRTSSYAFVRVHNWALFCTHFRPIDPHRTIAVGTALQGGPPHRSQRALLAHWAPALGAKVEAHDRERVHRADGW